MNSSLKKPSKLANSFVLSRFPIRFRYDISDANATTRDTYHAQLVLAEILMCRALSALEAGLLPVHTRLSVSDEMHLLRRPRFSYEQRGSIEYLRWHDANGTARSHPLTREAMVHALTHGRHIPHATALALVSAHSHALKESDQYWLAARALAPTLKRPLLAEEYALLASAIERIYRLTTSQQQACSSNLQQALDSAGKLGWFHAEYQRSPFHTAALSAAFKREHLECLKRRANEAMRHERRVKGLARADRLQMQAKAARHRAEHFAYLANRAVESIAA